MPELLLKQAREAVAGYAGQGLDPDLAMTGLRTRLEGAAGAKAGEMEAFRRPAGRVSICYVANAPYYNLFRESLAVRRELGWHATLLNLTGINNAFQQAYFDRVQGFRGDIGSLLRAVEGLDPDVIQVLGWHHAHYLPMLLRLRFPDRPVLCEFQDLVSAFLRKAEFVSLWGQKPAEAELEHVAERYIVENADGLLFPYAPPAADFLAARYELRCPTLSLPAYPFTGFFAPERTGEDQGRPRNRLLFVGGLPATNEPDIVFGDAKLLNLLPSLLVQALSFTVFNNPLLPTDTAVYFPEHLELARHHLNYRFMPGVPPDRLREYAAHYDYGAMLYRFDGVCVRQEHLDAVLPSKFYTYMEMGLPVLVTAELAAVAELVREHGVGRVLEPQDMGRLGDMLAGMDWPALHRNVLIYRERYSSDAQAPNLAGFLRPFAPVRAGAEQAHA